MKKSYILFWQEIFKPAFIPHRWGWLALSFFSVVGLFFLLATFISPIHSARDDNISGWGWSPLTPNVGGSYRSGFGYVSFNDCWNINGQRAATAECLGEEPSFAPYGLKVDFASREITGWAWSQGAGWICFGNSCCSAGGSNNYCTDFEGSSWEPRNPDLIVQYAASGDPAAVSGWAKVIAWDRAGWMSLQGDNYGLRFSTSTLEISGLAWNGFADTVTGNTDINSLHGYGWLCINENTSWPTPQSLCPFTGLQVAVPYVRTTDGDLYSQSDIAPDLLPAGGKYNATYLILANGQITNFISEEKDLPSIPISQRPASYTLPYFPLSVGLPKASNNFFNVLGRLDIPGLSEQSRNKYGQYEYLSSMNLQDLNYSKSEPYRVIVDNNATIRRLNITSGAPITFIINGDLSILDDITYGNSSVADFSDLPTVAFIVRGDVLISPAVKEIAGNFVVIGADGVNCDAASCGRFDTVYPGSSDDTEQLTVRGLVMAKKFLLERAYSSVLNEPSENIIYDGRLLVNPPPGFQDFAKGLPLWSEVAPQ